MRLLAVLAACAAPPRLTELKVGPATVSVELADTPEERQLGLMYRDTLPADQGMLFVYPDAQERRFWMKNTRVPLSIAFIDPTGVIVSMADMTPLDTRTTPSEFAAMYALEVNRGWFQAHGVKVGDAVVGLPGPASR